MAKSWLTYKPRSLARLGAVQALYLWEHSGTSVEQIMSNFLKDGVLIEDEPIQITDTALFSAIVDGVSSHLEAIDAHIRSKLNSKWRIERLDKVLLALLRAGVYELMAFNNIDSPIIISEYITIAGGFFDPKQVAFVNGLLDYTAQEVRSNK